jgi:hypothetical protein
LKPARQIDSQRQRDHRQRRDCVAVANGTVELNAARPADLAALNFNSAATFSYTVTSGGVTRLTQRQRDGHGSERRAGQHLRATARRAQPQKTPLAVQA